LAELAKAEYAGAVTATMNISLPRALRAFVEERVSG
jgi:hypothetical protein